MEENIEFQRSFNLNIGKSIFFIWYKKCLINIKKNTIFPSNKTLKNSCISNHLTLVEKIYMRSLNNIFLIHKNEGFLLINKEDNFLWIGKISE